LDEGRLGVMRGFTEMIVQEILKRSLENVHIVEILVKMRIQNSIKTLLLCVEKSFGVFYRTVMTEICIVISIVGEKKVKKN